MTFLPLLLIVVVFYFLLIRPQQKRAKEARELQNNVQAGAKVMLTSGILGEVVEAGEDNKIQVQVAEGVIITVVRQAIGQVLPEHDETDESDGGDSAEAAEDGETAETVAEPTEPTQDPGVIVDLDKSKSKDSSN